MLGSGAGSGKSINIKKIVKNGLQAWYKADRTQAPLGEEEIANGSFATGPELVSNGDFSNGITGWVNLINNGSSAGLATITDKGGYLRLTNATTGTNTDWRSKFVEQVFTWESGKTYQIKFKARASENINSLYVRSKKDHSDDENIAINQSLTTDFAEYTFYYTAVSDSDDISFGVEDWHQVENSQYIEIDDVSVKRTDPNDNWSTANRTWTVEDGKLSHTQGTNDAQQCRQENVIKPGKKYQVSYSILDYTSGSVRVDLGDANQGTARNAVGDYSEVITNTGTATFLDIEPVTGGSGTFKGDISNISVREITNSVKDFSSNTNNGVLYSGKALSFDGSDDYVDIDYWKSKTINADTKATFAAWFNDNNVSAGDFIFGSWTVDGEWFYLAVTDGKLDLGWGSSGWTGSVTSGTLPSVADNTWYRAVAVVDGLTCRVYLNGEFVFSKTNSSSFTIHSEGISIGTQGNAHGDFWDGELADFQIYDKAWAASDVTYDYNNPDKDVFDDEGRTEVVSDIELVSSWTNSDFDEFTSSGSNITQMVSGANGDNCYSNSLTVTSGKTYRVEFTSSQSVSNCQVRAATSILMSGADVISGGFSEGLNTFTFTASKDRAYVGFRATGSFTDTQITNFSFKEVTTQAGEISPTNCTALYRLNEGAGNRLYNAAPVLREDLLSGYNLNNWSKLSGAVVKSVNSFASEDEDGGVSKVIVENGKTYKLTIAGTTTATGVQFRDASATEIYYEYSGTGGFNDTIVFEAQSTEVYLKNKTAGTTTVTTLKLQEISLSESYVQEDWASSNWKTAQPYIPQYAMSSYSKKMVFDGSNDYVALDSEKTIAADEAFSFSFWYYNIATSGDQAILGNNGSTDFIMLDAGDEGLDFQADGNSGLKKGFNFDSGSELIAGKLNHIVLTKATGGSGIMKCYLNGIVQTDTETAPNEPFDYQHIFRSDTNYGEGFIDELAHFSKELSATEVKEIFNAGMALDCRDHSAYLGSEIVNDGGFDDHLQWNIATGWTVSGGKASVNATDATIRQILSVTQGKIYDLTFEISDYVKGAFQFGYNQFNIAGTSDNLPNFYENGVYNYRIVALSNNIDVYMYGVNASEFSIDNLSLREVNLKGYWRNNGSDAWTDLSPYGNNGTVNGSPTTIQLQEVPYFKKDTFGLPMNKVRQKGLNFDGDSYVKVEDDNSLSTMSGGFTCSFWFLHSENIGDGNWHYLVTKGKGLGADPDNGFSTAIYENVLYFDLNTKTTLTGASYGADPTITYNTNSDVASGMLITGNGVLAYGDPAALLRVGAIDSSNTQLEAEDKEGNSQNVSSSSYTGQTITLNQRSTVVKTLGVPSNPTWRYITATYTNNGNLRLYVDDTLQKTSSNVVTGDVSTTAEALPIVIGSSKVYNYKSTQVIDDVKWYNRPLGLSEIKKNYKATKSKHSSTSTWSDDFSSDFI